MRFGKTFATYQLALKMGWRKVLVLTFKPAVQSAWEEDLKGHVDFKGWQFISPGGLAYEDIDKKKPFVCFGSFQDYLVLVSAQRRFVSCRAEPAGEETEPFLPRLPSRCGGGERRRDRGCGLAADAGGHGRSGIPTAPRRTRNRSSRRNVASLTSRPTGPCGKSRITVAA